MPRAGIEIAEILVLHLVDFGKKLDQKLIRIPVIGRDVVSDDVPDWTENESDVFLGQEINRPLNLRPIAKFKGHVMDGVFVTPQKVDGVMIGTAPHEREQIATPVRNPKAKN